MSQRPIPLVLVVHTHAIDERVSAGWKAHCGHRSLWQDIVASSLEQAWSEIAGRELPRLLLRADCQLHAHSVDRMLQCLQKLDRNQVCTSLTDRSAQLFPQLADAPATSLALEHLDAACALLAEPALLPIQGPDDPAWLAADAQVRSLDEAQWLLDCQQFVISAGRAPTAPQLPADPRERPPEPLWAALASQLAALPAGHVPAPAGRDQRPVVLHLLHGWGGGAQRWIHDLAALDSQRHHLILRADSSASRHLHGQSLHLLDARQPKLVLREMRLAPPIATLEEHHPQYASLLHALIDEFGVEQLWVSSLIGHALDALEVAAARCALRWVAHDYFPFWPVLHVDFGDPARHFDAAELERDLRTGTATMLREPAQRWQQRARRVVDTLVHHHVPMIAPDRSVQHNLQRMQPALAGLDWHIIAHGVDLLPAGTDSTPTATRHERLRVLVPGRIQGGKGLDLLLPALDGILEHCELYLLGCGAAGMQLFGRAGVHVELDFEPEQLPALIQRIAPDLALLPRTVAETFSYVLSEMWALQVPVLGTRLGSLASRIQHGVNGWLCEPQADALLAALTQLSQQPEALLRVRQALALQAPRSRAQMLSDYLPLLPQQRTARAAAAVVATPAQLHALDQAGRVSRLRLDLQHQQQRSSQAESEVHRRGEWGYQLQRLVDQRTQWAQSLERELLDERDRHQQQLDHVDQLQQQLQLTLESLEQDRIQLQQLHQHREQLEAQLHSTQQHLSHSEAELGAERQRISELLTSSSWRMTAPLRVLMRQQRRLRESLAYKVRSLRQLARRGLNSLRQRGFSATLQRLLRGAAPPPALSIATEPLPDSAQAFVPFDLPERGPPVVSVIIPVYNKFAYTEACLRSLARVVDETPFEVIVVDDGSSDATWDNLQRIGGITAHRNTRNLGFIGACNKGAELAGAEFVFFLNNDTQVQDGFLSELLKVFASRPDAGLVGSKLIYPDGRLQECGGIIFSDGSGWNYGRFEDPQHAYFNFVREVDYVSGAAITLRRQLFWQLGGFDTLYAPAYYEDTDLAFKVRAQAGLKVYVAPASRVVHFEGITSGTDLASGIKRYQVVNQEKFLQRWAGELARHPAAGSSILKARQHRVRRRVLVIDACTPMPDQDSGSLRMFNLLRLLLEDGAAVSFFNEDRAYHPGYAEALQALGVEMLFHPWLPEAPAFFRERGSEFDIIILSRHYVAERFLPLIKDHASQARLWFDTVDLHYLRERRAAELSGDQTALKAAAHTQAQECALMLRCDLTLVVSAVEQQLLAQDCPAARVEVLSNIHDIPGRSGELASRRDICFIGGFQHPPNVDAVLWFASEVWPLVLQQAPDLVLHLIGSRTPEQISALASDNIIVHGFVADLQPFMSGCRLSVAPLRYGAGVKGKVNMSMSHGLPVVATSVAVEGMFLQAGVDALIADSPAEFAAAVLQGCSDDALWQRLSDASVANVERHFSLDAARGVLERLYTL